MNSTLAIAAGEDTRGPSKDPSPALRAASPLKVERQLSTRGPGGSLHGLVVIVVPYLPGREIEFGRSEERLAFHPGYLYSVRIMDIQFEWDESKSRLNKRKHGVSFDEAQTVFLDENAIRFFDPDHSENEDRFLMLGISFQLRILVVCHCFRANDAVIRIISARKADGKEETNYWNWR